MTTRQNGELPSSATRPRPVRARSPEDQLRLLLRLSETLASTTGVDEIANRIALIARQHFDAMFGAVAVVDSDGDNMHYLSLDPLPAELQATRRAFSLSSRRPAAVATRERRPIFVETLDEVRREFDGESAAAAEASGAQAFAYVPMLLGRTAVGALLLAWSDETTFDEQSRQLFWALARYTGQAIARAQLIAERREVAHTLQAALLPVLPTVPWLELAARYRPAVTADTVGGDWYDAFVSSPAQGNTSATLTAVVGDVTGHDTHAAAEMGRLQAKLRALAIDRPESADRLLERLNRVMRANIYNRLATAFVANLRATYGSVSMDWSNAGHPPPMLLEPGREPRFLQAESDLLLGLPEGDRRRGHHYDLPPGSTLVAYTDGLVERRGYSLDSGMQALLALGDAHRDEPLNALTDALLPLAQHNEQVDDIVVLALRTPVESG